MKETVLKGKIKHERELDWDREDDSVCPKKFLENSNKSGSPTYPRPMIAILICFSIETNLTQR